MDYRRNLYLGLVLFDIGLVIMYFVALRNGSWTALRLFNLDDEGNVGAWWTGSQYLASGVLLCVSAFFCGRQYLPSKRFCWLVGLGFIFLSLDEIVMIHEMIHKLSLKYAEWVPLFTGNKGAWISIYGVIGILLIVVTRRDILLVWAYKRSAFMLIAVGFATIVAGAVLIEIAGYEKLIDTKSIQVALEEFLEMLGGSTVLIGTITFFASTVSLKPAAAA